MTKLDLPVAIENDASTIKECYMGLLPDSIRQNLTYKLLLLLLVGTTISGAVVAVSYISVNDDLTEQVEAQVESDTTIQATVYENWLRERWSSLENLAEAPEMHHDSPSVLHQWLVAEQTGISPAVESLHIVETESGTILGSTISAYRGTNIYERGVDSGTTDRLLFISSRPVRFHDDGKEMTLIGTHSKDRMLVAAVPANISLVSSSTYDGEKSALFSLDGHRLIGNTDMNTLSTSVDPEAGTTVSRTDESIIGTRVIAHDLLDARPLDQFDSTTSVGTIVVTATPKTEAFGFRKQILNTLFVTFGLTFILLIGTAVVSMRSVTRDINRLSDKARQISEGVFDVDVTSYRSDELGMLYRSIGEMRDSLENRIEAERQRKEELKAAREEAKSRQQELREIIDLVPDRIFVRTRDGDYLLANEATAESYDTSAKKLENRSLDELETTLEKEEKFRDEDIQVIDSNEPIYLSEEELEGANGKTRIFQTTKIPFEPAGTDETAVLGYAREITELKEYERQLESQRNNLEVLNKMVRHDIRNNLQLVIAYAETLEPHLDSDEEIEYLEKVLESAHQAVDITRSARDVAEVLLQTDSELESIPMGEMLEEEIVTVQSRYDKAVIEPRGTVPDMLVEGDELVASVFRNLLQNAIVHNDSTVPRVQIACEKTDDIARVRIADNGPGISDERKETIFEEGQKGLDSDGTGLGLYLVRTLVEQYGGSVWVEDREEPFPEESESETPTGAVFIVELPLAE